MLPILGRMPMIACATTDLPEPDSPTSATVLPCGTRKLTPRTASSGPVSRLKVMRRSRTSSRLPAPLLACGCWLGCIKPEGIWVMILPHRADGGEVVHRGPVDVQIVLARGMRGAGDDLGEAGQGGFDLDPRVRLGALQDERHPAFFATARCRIETQRQPA